jgi:hypothetical protein
MSCIARENDFHRVNSFVWIGGICDDWWTFLVSFLVNVSLTTATILLATHRWRYERHLQFWYKRGSRKWNVSLSTYFWFVMLHQSVRVLNFLFLVYTNWLQLLIGVFLNTGINYYMYKNDWIPNDYQRDTTDRSDITDKKDESIVYPALQGPSRLYLF